MDKILERISLIGILPVVVLEDAEAAVPLARAMERGGIPAAEVTFRTGAAEESIRRIAAEVPGVLVGAGTVTSVELAERAVRAGAKFIVSPGLNPAVVRYCLENGIPVVPGVSSPTEIEAAMGLGLSVLKFFPAEQVGGRAMLKALASPYGGIRFIPTGGVGKENLNDYLSLPNVLACGGSWICPASLSAAGRFDEIEELCRQAVRHMHGFTLEHVGINLAGDAGKDAREFGEMFSLPVRELPGSFFAGEIAEFMKGPFLGDRGHIAIGVNNVDRAAAYFEARGYGFREETKKRDARGLTLAYFEKEIGGFALHLVRKG